MEHQMFLSNNLTPATSVNNSTASEAKGSIYSHNRNVSLDSSLPRVKGLNLSSLAPNNDNHLNVSSISPGAHSVTGALDESLNLASVLITANSSKGGSSSRRSSPASKKKLTSESIGVSGGSGRRRSPLVSRKAPIGSETSFTTPPSSRARFSSNHEEDQKSMDEKDIESKTSSSMFNDSIEASGPECSSTPYRGINESDDFDGSHVGSITPSNQQQKAKEVLEQLQAKIQKTTELIEDEQRIRDENVNEYLQLSSNADRHQLARIKTVFEKKNQKSAATIQHLQKKLDNYRKKKKEVEHHGIPLSHRQPKEVLREVGYGLRSVGDNIRDGLSGFSGKKGLIGKPKEIAHLLKNKFGSADNIKELGEEEKEEERNHHGSATLPPNSGLHPTTSSIALVSKTPASGSGGGGSGGGGGGGGSSGGGKMGSEEGSECNSSITSESISANMQLGFTSPPNHHGMSSFEVPIGTPFMETIMQELKERQEDNARLREEIEMIKQTLANEVGHMVDTMLEEKVRYERLEEQVNDLTELHQNEMENLKTAVKDLENMEEKVQYKNEENIKDLNEMVESCQTKIFRMEHQQAQQQQQFLTLEGLENSNARMLFVKLINILLTVLQVLLLIVATVAGILTPLLQTKTRLVTTATVCLFILFIYLQLSEIRDSWQVFLSRVSEILT